MAVEERNRSLRDTLLQNLSAILSPQQEVRAAAEEYVETLEVTEGSVLFHSRVTFKRTYCCVVSRNHRGR